VNPEKFVTECARFYDVLRIQESRGRGRGRGRSVSYIVEHPEGPYKLLLMTADRHHTPFRKFRFKLEL
jgi:hypothetical protein